MKLFLDDVRDPQDCAGYMYKRIGALNPIYVQGGWHIVRNYEQFKEAIECFYKRITHISFDHDLADEHIMLGHAKYVDWDEYHRQDNREKTGLDCARLVKQFYQENELPLPIMFVHSMNPVGTENIINVFK